ncbi:hypothetical protein [Kribbella shirazensis]|uniref:Uncharacterized protein n=1 Tax=Kribbella shirazensis TaxID=1105143 RepID=A0A7X5V994_9ACTN|nr:hypothetical protein [Kribbella shirazensis]NIK56213.1 hypothetical protein [Kribbella shirazensis]
MTYTGLERARRHSRTPSITGLVTPRDWATIPSYWKLWNWSDG